VNRSACNLEHSEYIVGGWPWQILGMIHAVATICQILQHSNTKMSTGVAVKTLKTEF